MKSSTKRITIGRDPGLMPGYIFAQPPWDAWWVEAAGWDGRSAGVWAFRRSWTETAPRTVRIHVTADQRYDLYLDGRRVGWGSERGSHASWYYETYELTLQPGAHTLVARVFWGGVGEIAACAQVTARPGLMVYAEGETHAELTTGVAPWQGVALAQYELEPPQVRDTYCVPGGRTVMRGDGFPWGWEAGDGDEWMPVLRIQPVMLRAQGAENSLQWVLSPATLPPMFEETLYAGRVRSVSDALDKEPVRECDASDTDAAMWQRALSGESPATVPPGATRRVLVDLDEYYCAWPQLICSGGRGAEVRVAWAESLFEEPTGFAKGNRDLIDGKHFRGLWDTFYPDGGDHRCFEPLWWEAGRYVMISIRTAEEELKVEGFSLRQTHYPHVFESMLELSDERWRSVERLSKRVLEMCSHETYMDCPYYEQLMYAGDTRLEILTTYATTRDDRLPRKAIRTFDQSRSESGLTLSRSPTRVKQVIPPFSLWWVMMVRDYAFWRDDPAFVRARMSGVRSVLESFRECIGDDDLVHAPKGWNFVDWVPSWPKGMPPGAESGVNASVNLQAAWTYRAAAELEEATGEPLLAGRNRQTADALTAAAVTAFWDNERGLFAEDLEHSTYSEHAQCMAILGDALDSSRRERVVAGLCEATDLARTTVYYSYYLFEALRAAKRVDHLYKRLDLWFGLEAQGLRTVVEMPEPTRSDCHAWGSHPLFHAYATLCGIRPAALSFERVLIEPQPGPLDSLRASLVHPRGTIELDLVLRDGSWRGRLATPAGVGAEARLPGGKTVAWDGGAVEV